MPFGNPLAAGVALIRAALRSPNFVTGVSGWTINKDGTAEFSAGQFRGVVSLSGPNKGLFVYRGTPGLGTLAVAIATDFGTDAYSNIYSPGISLYENTTSGNIAPISFYSGNGLVASTPGPVIEVINGALSIDGNKGSLPMLLQNSGGGGIDLDAQFGNIRFVNGPVKFNAGLSTINTVQFGSGYPQLHYAEGIPIGTNTGVPNNAVTRLNNLNANIIQNDYNPGISQFNAAANIWTCPANGWYNFTCQVSYLAWVNGSRSGIYIVRAPNGSATAMLHQDIPSSAAGRISVSGRRHLSTGDTVTFNVYQSTGVAQSIDVGEQSYIHISQDF